MKILKSSVSLLLVLGGGIGLTSYLTSCSCSNSTPTPSKPIPFTDEYFEWTTSADKLTITGLQSGVDLSNYDTLSIPATYTDGNSDTYFITAIGVDAFNDVFNDSGTNTITLLNLVNASNLLSINENAFFDCSGFTGSLTIPNSVTDIDDYAFYGCSGFNEILTIGNLVINVGNRAFSRARFTNVINNSQNFNLADNVGNAKVLISASSGTGLDYENGSVVGCIAFGQLTIPDSVTSIGYKLFDACSGLTGPLIIPDSVITINQWAFRTCWGFTGALTIPNSVISIIGYAFQGCSGFTGSLTIPNSVTDIGSGTFESCTRIDTINVSDWTTIPTIGNYAFLYFNTEGGIVLVPSNYDDLGITISTFKGLPDTWQLQVI